MSSRNQGQGLKRNKLTAGYLKKGLVENLRHTLCVRPSHVSLAEHLIAYIYVGVDGVKMGDMKLTGSSCFAHSRSSVE